jgi:peptide/nickel transport system permease protein
LSGNGEPATWDSRWKLKMQAYILRRFALSIVVLFGVSVLVFLMLHLVPGDPVTVMLSEHATQQDAEALRHELGLDQPLYIQYLRYLERALHGDLGRSIRLRRPVMSLIIDRFPNTLELAVASLALAGILGITLGVLAAVYRETLVDYTTMITALLGVSTPSFWLGLMLILLFGLRLRWLPIAGNQEGLKSLILPAVTLAMVSMAIITRLTRSSLLEVLGEDYIRTARAKGLRELVVILRHALKNGIIPVITVLGLQFGFLLGGAIIVETVFVWPGIGRLAIDAIIARDFPLVQGITLFVAVGFVLINLMVDILYAYFDPRIHYG